MIQVIALFYLATFVLALPTDGDSQRWTRPSNPTLFPSASLGTVRDLPTETDIPVWTSAYAGKVVDGGDSSNSAFSTNDQASDPSSNPKFSQTDDGGDSMIPAPSSQTASVFSSTAAASSSTTAAPSSSTTSSTIISTPSAAPKGSDLSPYALQTWTLTPDNVYTTITAFMTAIKGAWGWNRDVTTVPQSIPLIDWSKSALTGPTAWNNGSSIRATYPKDSLTPGKKPLGGMSFYANPLDMSNANNVSLGYSVFFPADFNFVLGGKLPGLYGGKKGCSGGYGAADCFSTRMMWRSGGMGEMYLYAPRGKQSQSLCQTPPLTYCNAADGMSIGRGSFTFARGAWTHIRQDIWLNTPGVADGGFNIWINGKLAMSNNQTIFRNTIAQSSSGNVKALPVQILDNSMPSRGFVSAFPAIGSVQSPFAPAINCSAGPSVNFVYGNGATKVVVTKVRKNVITKTRTFTRVQTATNFATVTSLATVTLPVTVSIPIATTTFTNYLNLRPLQNWFYKRARKTTTITSFRKVTTTVDKFVTSKTSVNATQTYRQTITIPTTVATESYTVTIFKNVVGAAPPAVSNASGSSASANSTVSSSLVVVSTSTASASTTKATSVKTSSAKSTAKPTTAKTSSIKTSSAKSSSQTTTKTSTSSSATKASTTKSTSTSATQPVGTAVGNDRTMNPQRPFGFAGIMAMTFFGGSGQQWRATKDEHTYFNNWEFSINN